MGTQVGWLYPGFSLRTPPEKVVWQIREQWFRVKIMYVQCLYDRRNVTDKYGHDSIVR
jgi:hypothetical protein